MDINTDMLAIIDITTWERNIRNVKIYDKLHISFLTA